MRLSRLTGLIVLEENKWEWDWCDNDKNCLFGFTTQASAYR